MPQSDELRTHTTDDDAIIHALIKERGFIETLRILTKGQFSNRRIGDVYEGLYEESTPDSYNLSLHTEKGHLYFPDAKPKDHSSPDPQIIPSSTRSSSDATADSEDLTTDELLHQLTDAGTNPTCSLICMVELARFNSSQNQRLLPLLWQYILHHRNSNDQSELIAVGAAIRKYIAIMPMDRMDELAVLLESGNKSPLPIDLEIEVAKMIYRNFEVFPPETADPQPELAQRLLEMAQAYTNPRILLRDKHAAAASLAIEAIVAMRSPLAEKALQAAIACPYRWFTELVSDDLDELQDRWIGKSENAAGWLSELRSRLLTEK